MPIMSNIAGHKADNALRAIEAALQELLLIGLTQTQIQARWATHSDDSLHASAISASLGRRGVAA